MRKQVEVLEHESDVRTLFQDLAVTQFVESISLAPVSDQLSVDPYGSAVDFFEVIEGPQQGGLTGTRRTENDGHFALANQEINAGKYFQGTERLVNSACFDGVHRIFGQFCGLSGRTSRNIETRIANFFELLARLLYRSQRKSTGGSSCIVALHVVLTDREQCREG